MKIIEYSMIAILACLGLIATISDIRKGIIRNKVILFFLVLAVVLDLAYYTFFAREMWLYFFVNIAVIVSICSVLYVTHSLAGGDCKLIFVMTLLYPAGGYLIYNNSLTTVYFSVCFAFLFGYIYLFVSSIISFFDGKKKTDFSRIKSTLLTYLKNYGIAFVYISAINLILEIWGKYVFPIPNAIIFAVCFVIAWLSSKSKFLRKIPVIIFAVAMDILLAIILKMVPISLNPMTYLFTFALILCQMTIRTSLYTTIKTENIQKGMILSLFSSVLMQNSKIEKLPGISTEDLGSRLTEEEAESVRRWGQSAQGHKEIIVVKKIPFAIFIFLGYMTYFTIWSVMK